MFRLFLKYYFFAVIIVGLLSIAGLRYWSVLVKTAAAVGSTSTNTILTVTDEGNQNSDSSWGRRVFFDPNNDRWHVIYIDALSDIHSQSTAENSGTTWVDGIDIDAGTWDYEDFSCEVDVNGSSTYLHCVYNISTDHLLYYKRCTLSGTGPYISCDARQTVYTSADTIDDVSYPNVTLDSNRCVLISAVVEDDSVVSSLDEHQIYLWKEAATCGDGTWGNETGSPWVDIQTEAGYNAETPTGIRSFGDLDAQIYWLDTDTTGTFQLETVFFDGDTNTFGTQVTLDTDVEGTTTYTNYDSVIAGSRNVTFAMDDATTDVDAYNIAAKDGTTVTQVDTLLNTPFTASNNQTLTAVVDTEATGADDIWVFAADTADARDIYYNKSTDGGATWGGSTTAWVTDYDTTEVKYFSAGFSAENCDIMVSWLGNALTPWNVNTKIINTGSCIKDVTVGSTGSQTSSITKGTTAHVGGAFTLTATTSQTVTGITIAEQGTINASTGLDNVKLYYENDTSAPYDCASESYAGTETQFGSTDTDGFSAANGTSAFTGSVAVSTTSTMCVYVVLDVTTSANVGDAIEIQITNPSTDVTLGSGTIGPKIAVEISGTTTAAAAISGWYGSNWGYRKKITIDADQVSGTGTLTNFPVLISLSSDSDLVSHAQTDGDDILFTSDDAQTKLDHDFISYNSGTGALVAWVEVTSLSGSTDTDIYMYYGNSGATAQENESGTWNSDFKAVWHLDEASGTHYDATSNNFDSTTISAPTQNATGKVQKADTFDGSNDYVATADIDYGASDNISVSAWVNFTTCAGTDVACYIVSKHNFTSSSPYTLGIAQGDNVFFTIGSSTFVEDTDGNSDDGSWHHVYGTYDGTTTRVYLDGVEQASGAQAAETPNDELVVIGGDDAAPTYRPFNGTIDEVKITGVAMSADWVTTEYSNQNSPATFYAVATQESQPVSGPTIDQTLRHGMWFNSSGVRQAFTF